MTKRAKKGPVKTAAPPKPRGVLASLPVGPIRPKPGSMLIEKVYKRPKK